MHYNINDNEPYTHKFFWPVISLSKYYQDNEGWFHLKKQVRRKPKEKILNIFQTL